MVRRSGRSGVAGRAWAVALAVVLGAGVVAAALTGAGCVQQAVQETQPGGGVDRAIRAAVLASIRSDPRTQTSQIDATVSGRVVTLTGQAAGGDAKFAAVELAQKISDVTQVVDQMTVAPGTLP